MEGKLLIFAAPSGSGKTTIVNHLLSQFKKLSFSISATTRSQRPGEIHGKNYYFLSVEEFKAKIKERDFAEYEEVYKNQFYGTLKSELERIWANGQHIVFDIDVKGAMTLKELYKDQCLTVFVKPPDIQTLVDRLRGRNTEDAESFKKRIQKAKKELSYEGEFDMVLHNNDLATALAEAEDITSRFLNITK